MKQIVFILIISTALFSCEKYAEQGTEVLESFQFSIIGNDQLQQVGQYLEQEVGAIIDLSEVRPQTDQQFKLEITAIKGGGSVDNDVVIADQSGKMATRWTMGSDSNDQKLSCRILDSNNQIYSEFEIYATALFPNQWNTVKLGYLVGIQDMVRDTLNQRSMMLSNGRIYLSTNNFYKWELNYNYYSSSIRQLEINSKGDVFAVTSYGEILKTSNWGDTWENLGHINQTYAYNIELSITNDDYIWFYSGESGLYCSKNNGVTWTRNTSGLLEEDQLGRVYNHGDTSHLVVSKYRNAIMQTTDDGISWQQINTPESTVTMFVTDDNAIITQNLFDFTLNKSTDGGQTYFQVFQPNLNTSIISGHLYDKFKNLYYVLAPGVRIWTTTNFEDYTPLIACELQRNLFIDHEGNIYASGLANRTPTQPTLIFPNTN